MIKRILFMCPDFFGYSNIILEELQKHSDVDFFFNNFIEKQNFFKRKFMKKKLCEENNNFYETIYEKIKGNTYTHFLFIKGNMIPNNFFEKLKKLNPNIKIISYQWDDIDNCKEILDKKKYLSKLYTYSKYDEKKYNIEYFPMFLKNKNIENNIDREFEILNIGTLHENRLKIYRTINLFDFKIKNHILKGGLKTYLKYKIFLKKSFRLEKRALTHDEYLKILRKSKAILDLPIENQKGLTTRVYEGLSNGVKVITFNEEIKNYEFYNKNNILILEKINYKKIYQFLKKDFDYENCFLSENCYISKWVYEILRK